MSPHLISSASGRASKPNFSAAMVRQEFGAGFVGGIVELFAGMIVAEMFRVFGGEKCALVMIEPPGEQRRAGIFEIDDGVFVAVEVPSSNGCGGLVSHSGIEKFRVGVDPFAIKARKDCRGAGSVETFIVETDANFHRNRPHPLARRVKNCRAQSQ